MNKKILELVRKWEKQAEEIEKDSLSENPFTGKEEAQYFAKMDGKVECLLACANELRMLTEEE